jgi:hypothetical protein
VIKNIIQAYEGEISPENAACMESIKTAIPAGTGYIFKDSFPPEIDRSKGLRNASDIFRFEWLIEHPNDIWIDCDVKMGERGWFNFVDNGKPYFANVFGTPDIWILAPMGRADFIQAAYKQALTIEHPVLGNPFCNFVNNQRGNVNLIQNGWFIHTSKR